MSAPHSSSSASVHSTSTHSSPTLSTRYTPHYSSYQQSTSYAAYTAPRPAERAQSQPASTDNTAWFLHQGALLAEAVKRAEMAVVMRDLEDMGL